MNKPTRARTDDLANATWLTVEQAQTYYQMSRKGVIELALSANALGVFGKRQRVHRQKCDECLLSYANSVVNGGDDTLG